MSTRNIVPRNDGEGNLGTSLKNWLKGWFKELFCSGNLTDGTNNISISEAKSSYNHSLLITGNPHNVTKTDINLENVPNLDTTTAVEDAHTHANATALDAVTNVNTGDQDLSGKEDKINKGDINGYASLDGDIKLPIDELTIHEHAAGFDGEPIITDNGNGTVSVATTTVWFFTDSTRNNTTHVTIVGGTILTPTNDITGYICADRDTEDYTILNSVDNIDYLRYIPYFIIFKSIGSNNIHTQKIQINVHTEIDSNHQRLLKASKYSKEVGALESINIDSSLNITVSGGGVWVTNHKYEIVPVSPSTRQFNCEYNGTSWVVASHVIPVINNTQYNSLTGYATLTNTYWTINYLYRGIEEQDHIYIVLGREEYATSILAQASSKIAMLPEIISSHSLFIGRVIVQKSATTGIISESAFDTVFMASSSISDHGSLSGLGDDDHLQYHNDTRGDARYTLKNSNIVAATKTKITYDTKGLVTEGTNATTTDITDSSNKRYVTDTQLTVIGNTSGTNTGDETVTTLGAKTNAATDKLTPVDADLLGLVDSVAANILKKLTWSNLKTTLKIYFDTIYLKRVAGDINSFTEKTPAVANDIIIIEDSADSYNKKKIKLSSIPYVGDMLKATYDSNDDGIVTKAFMPDFQYITSDGESSTTSSTYQNKTTLTFTPPNTGDYLIQFNVKQINSANSRLDYVRLYQDGTTALFEFTTSQNQSYPDYFIYSGFIKITLTATSHTFILQWKSEGNTAYIKSGRIMAWRVS
jgi:hypothetical protein